MPGLHPILMADIAGSSRHSRKRTLMRQFAAIVAAVNEQCAEQLASPLTITLGDEFQGVANSVPGAVSAVVALEETRVMHGSDFRLRYVLHVGRIDTAINPQKAHAMLGAGLTRARELLDELKSNKDRRVRVSLGDRRVGPALEDALALLLSIGDDWRPSDFEFVKRFLQGMDYAQVAEQVGRDPSSTWRREKSLKMSQYFAARRLVTFVAGCA